MLKVRTGSANSGRRRLSANSLKLVDVFGEVVYHELGVLDDDVSNESVGRRPYLQLLLRLSQPNTTNLGCHLS